MSNRATEQLLGQLHNKVAEELLARIKSGEATPAELNAAIKFLSNNGIESLPSDRSPLHNLQMALPTFDDDDPALGLPN